MSNRAADINPNDIETISILKGAAATGLYGVRAANGAVVITTKNGKSGKGLTINVGYYFWYRSRSISFLNFRKILDGVGMVLMMEVCTLATGALIEAQSVVDPTYVYYDNNYEELLPKRRHERCLFQYVGWKRCVYFLYICKQYSNRKGIIPFSDWGRTSVRFRGSAKFSEKFSVEASVNYSNSGGNRVPHTSMGERLMYWSHTQDITNYKKPDGTQVPGILSANPLWTAEFWPYEDQVDRTIGNLTFNYKPS
jgi:TonB-dependent SusC/RagA subfamily outer membrane receptor